MLSILLPILPLLQSHAARAAELYSVSSTWGSIYYDLTNSFCFEPGSMTQGASWSPTNDHPTNCEPKDLAFAKTMAQRGSNSVVAFRQDLVIPNRAKWCGKQVQIFDQSGKELQGPDGPFYIWDSCEDCAKDDHIDLSGLAWSALGGDCTVDNPRGISYKVLDNNIKEYVEMSPGGGPGGAGVPSYGPPTSIGNIATISAPQVVHSAPVGGAGTCSLAEKGKYQCSGKTLQQCNFVSSSTQLDWQEITASCATYCDVTRTPICA